jgi:hypothetical protein
MSMESPKMATGARRRPIPDELGQALLQALAPLRPQAVSLHDASGETLWLSAGSIGPDEHNLVLASLDVFGFETRRESMHRKLEDGRRAVFLAARDPHGICSGAACAFVERKIDDDTRIVTPSVQKLMQRFSTLLGPQGDRTSSQSALTLARDGPTLADAAGAGASDAAASGPIRARKYMRLQSGGGIRRYEISLVPIDAAHDAAVLERVLEWLKQNSMRYQARPASFAVPISAAAALDADFRRRIGAALARHNFDEGAVLLSIPAAAWRDQPDATLPLLEMCDQHRCHVLLDDFTLTDVGLRLLRSKAVRMLKLSTELTDTAMQERYPRALLSACTHIARVLGIHCIAQHVESVAASRWLAVAGVDYLDQFNPARTGASAATPDEPEELQLVS